VTTDPASLPGASLLPGPITVTVRYSRALAQFVSATVCEVSCRSGASPRHAAERLGRKLWGTGFAGAVVVPVDRAQADAGVSRWALSAHAATNKDRQQ
jgi:hypothetical protein